MTGAGPRLRATYRVQLHAGFTFDDAAALAAYLDDLGISHLYCSPYLQAAPGSTHGYDVVDHTKLNEELGGEEAHARLAEALSGQGLGQILDIVPNHMALAGERNRWWWDVLENGRSSRYATYFDINWDPTETKLTNRVLVPVLGDHYGRVLEKGELTLVRSGGSFVVTYYDERVPVSPRSLDDVLAEAAEACGNDELASVAHALGRLPHSAHTDRESVEERHRDKEVLRSRLEQLLASQPEVAAAVDAVVARINADPDALDALLGRQNYRLAFWRVAGRELDYRRFFDITTLVGLRMEDPQVFEDTHALVLDLVRGGSVHGLRIDHPDGMRDPGGYLRRLADATGGTYVVVEKILEPGERLPESWPVAGTTGYDFLNRVGGVFVDADGEGPLTDLYARFTGETADFEELVHSCKLLVMRESLAADIERLTALFVDVVEEHRRYRDYTRWELREALRETIAAFDVYRTYVQPGEGTTEQDVQHVRDAVERARARRDDLDPQLFDFLADVLLLRVDGPAERQLALRFQQTSAAVMAKGVEDTAFYRFNRFVSLNEVGGDPARFGVDPAEFHEAADECRRLWPQSMLDTSTHDTKRSEDVRARLAVLSEIPGEWEAAVWRWAHLNDRFRRDGLPDRNAEYLLYQVLVGAWPLPADRAVQYMEKASKEAKDRTSWIDPVPEYDDALRAFVEGVSADEAFQADLEAFVRPLVWPGRVNAMAQLLLKLTAPGVPDLYQGTELWDLSLVDPDNRRPVDYDLRRRLLDTVRTGTVEDALAAVDEGAPKLLVARRALDLRRRLPDALDGSASYAPLRFAGDRPRHGLGYVRGDAVAVVVPRLVLGLEQAGGWGSTTVELPSGRWVDELTGDDVDGGTVPVAELLRRFPVALLRKA